MKPFLLALALLFASPCVADEFITQERVAALPQDQDAPYISVIGKQSDPRFQTITKWFDTNETLHALAAQSHFNVIQAESAHYRERLAESTPVLPCVRLQDGEGNVIQEFAGKTIPMTAEALAHGLNSTASKTECWITKKKNKDADLPGDKPKGDLPPNPPAAGFPWLLLIVATLLGSGLAVAIEYHQTHRGKSKKTVKAVK